MSEPIANSTACPAVCRSGLNLSSRWYIPGPGTDAKLWSVIACDQFTSEPDYWKQVMARIDRRPSTGHMIFPEVYLEHSDSISADVRIRNIHETMAQYCRLNVFRRLPGGLLVTRRLTSAGRVRHGVVTAVDLEAYDYRPGSRTLIRASEATVESRIPPRLRVRAGAPLETGHVLLLVNDPDQTVMPFLYRAVTAPDSGYEVVYDTDLMDGAGHLTGWFVPAAAPLLQDWLRRLTQTPMVRDHHLLFAVGDGNHSLATAKAHWEQLKAAQPDIDPLHPARFAMAEILSLSDPGLDFEPIHQAVFQVNYDEMADAADRCFGDDLVRRETPDPAAWQALWSRTERPASGRRTVEIPVAAGGRRAIWQLRLGPGELTLAGLRRFLDPWLRDTGLKTDYIHGRDSLMQLIDPAAPDAGSGSSTSCGFGMPALDPAGFFDQIIRNGALPRKTFSLGHALDKRFYMECRSIIPDPPAPGPGRARQTGARLFGSSAASARAAASQTDGTQPERTRP